MYMSIFLKKKKHSRRHGIGNYRLQDARRHCVLNPENERNSRGHHETDSPSPAQHEREQRTEQKNRPTTMPGRSTRVPQTRQ